MAQSPEYPDLKWMPPKSWTDANRTSVQLVVIHVTDGAARASAAEDGASYDQRRTDGTSTHYFHDSDSTIQCVRTADQAHAARAQGNRRGIQHELCTRADSANWTDAYHQAMLRKAAKQAARDAKKWDIPVRHLSVAQVANGVKGFCGHVDITHAFPQDNGTHTDPGGNFPWTQFLSLVRAELAPDTTKEDTVSVQEVVDGSEEYNKVTQSADSAFPGAKYSGNESGRNVWDRQDIPIKLLAKKGPAWQAIDALHADAIAKNAKLNALMAMVSDLAGKDFTDEPAIASAVLAGLTPERLGAAITDAGLTPEALAAAIPDDLAERTIELLGEKLRPSA